MADASKQVRPTQTVAQDDTNTTFASDTAIAREAGGTGVSVGTMAALTAELSAMTGTDGSSNGAKGLVPAPAGTGSPGTSDTYRPLRGDGTYGGGSSESKLWLSAVTDSSNETAFEFYAAASPVSHIWSYATSSPYYARLGTSSSSGLDVDINIEPKGGGRVTGSGDPFLKTIKSPRLITAKAFGTTFDAFGLTAPTVTTPGVAAATLDDANGVYVQMTNAPLTNRKCGIEVASATKRRLTPDFICVFRAPLLRSRLWIGLFSADPSAYYELVTPAIKGVGFYFDKSESAPTTNPSPSGLTIVAVDGTAKTFTRTSGSFISNGFRVGQTATWSGFANGGNNGSFVITTLTDTVMTVTDGGGTMTNEAAGASVLCTSTGTGVYWKAVASSGSATTETVTTAVPTANAWTAVRITNVQGSQWRFSVFNTSTNIWDHVTDITSNGPALGDQLGIYVVNQNIGGVTASRSDVTVTASGKTYTRAAGSWFDDGWRLGDSVDVAGFSNGGNNGSFVVSALTATVMTMASGSQVDEASGASVTFSAPATTMAVSTAALCQE